MQRLGLSDADVDDRLDALLRALRQDADAVAARIPGRNLWTAVTEVAPPLLRIYLRPKEDVPTEAELLWIEDRL